MLVFNIIISCHMVASNMDYCFYLEKHDQEKKISSSKRIQESISHTRWNQHNMSSYEVWGGWIQFINSNWNILGMECVRKEEIMRYATLIKAINIQKTKKTWLGNLLEKIWRLWWKSEKDRDPWQWISLGDVSTWIQDDDTYRKMS